MRTITKTAIVGGLGSLVAYLFLVRTRQLRRDTANVGELRAIGNSSSSAEEVKEKFIRLPLKAHSFLAGIPLHTLDYVELRGGHEQMTIADIYQASGLSEIGNVKLSPLTKALFDLRGMSRKNYAMGRRAGTRQRVFVSAAFERG